MIKLHLSESPTYFWYIKYWCQDQCLNINLSVIRKWNTSYNSNQIQILMDHSEFDVINLITNHFSTLNTLIFNYNFTHFWNSLLLYKECRKFLFCFKQFLADILIVCLHYVFVFLLQIFLIWELCNLWIYEYLHFLPREQRFRLWITSQLLDN